MKSLIRLTFAAKHGFTLFRVDNNSIDDVESAFEKFKLWYKEN